MKIALSTDTLKGYGLNRIFEFAKELGFDGIDLAMDAKDFDTMDIEYIGKLSTQTGISVVAIQTLDNAKPKDLNHAVEMAKALGTKVIIVQAPKILDRKYSDWLKKEVPNIRKKEEISIALENATNKMWLGFIPERLMNSMSELKKFKHACLDTSRAAEKKEDILGAYGNLQKFLVHIHISNVSKGKGYQPLTHGSLPLESLISRLAADGFKGAVSIKINPRLLKAFDKEQALATLKESKAFIEKYANE
jgi:sugar phosphate isomerase/epimerase